MEAIDEIENALQALHLNVDTTQAITTLASASRNSLDVRTRLADPDVLLKLVEVIECSLSDDLETTLVALRCIGNACIDNDTARGELTNSGLTWAKQCLRTNDYAVQMLTVKVLYNICSDFEPAQLQCYHQHVHYELISLCATPHAHDSDEKQLLIDLLFWITGQKSHDDPGALPGETLNNLLDLPLLYSETSEIEEFATLVEVCLTFVRGTSVQDQIIESKRVRDVWQMFTQIDDEIRQNPPREVLELLKPISSSLVWCLSDIAANPNFGQHYSFTDSLMRDLLHTTNTDSGQTSDRKLAAACQIVGNLLWQLSPDRITPLVTERAIHKAMWRRLVSPQQPVDEDLQHALAGFLIQLTRPSTKIRELLGDDENAEAALTLLCEHKTPHIKQDGIRLLRALGKDCPTNQQRFGALAASVMFAAVEDAPLTHVG